jgi:hypothetical protein
MHQKTLKESIQKIGVYIENNSNEFSINDLSDGIQKVSKFLEELKDSNSLIPSLRGNIDLLVTPLRRNIDYQSLARCVFSVEPLPEGANLLYYLDDDPNDE